MTSDNKEIIESYQETLKELRSRHRKMKSTNADRKTLSNMISSLEYSLFWLENGYERPPLDISPTKLSKDKREELWGEIEHADGIVKGVCDTYFWEETDQSRLTEKQIRRLYEAKTIFASFSNQELNVFILKHREMLEIKNIAIELNVSEKAVYNTLERTVLKINNYFNNKFTNQIDILTPFPVKEVVEMK